MHAWGMVFLLNQGKDLSVAFFAVRAACAREVQCTCFSSDSTSFPDGSNPLTKVDHLFEHMESDSPPSTLYFPTPADSSISSGSIGLMTTLDVGHVALPAARDL